jgi:hypothetical protein
MLEKPSAARKTTGMGKMQRRKGKVGEREVAAQVRAAMPWLADRVRRGWQTRQGDDDPDVIVPGLWLEVKRGRQPNPRAALAQAVDASKGRGTPIAVVRDDRKDAFAVVRWSDLLGLLAELMRYREVAALAQEVTNGRNDRTAESVPEQRPTPVGPSRD